MIRATVESPTSAASRNPASTGPSTEPPRPTPIAKPVPPARSAVGKDRKRTFPYFGYGYAWEKEMQGNVGGNPLTLEATQVARESTMGFPYRGYGRAWVQTMSGECGPKLAASLRVTAVEKRKEGRFPYFGFGYAWPQAAELTLIQTP